MQSNSTLITDLNEFSTKQIDASQNSNNAKFVEQQQTSNPFYFSNDKEFAKSISFVDKQPVKKIDPSVCRVALLVGESAFLSFTPELAKHVDVVIFVDIDKKVLKHNAFLVETMKKSASVEEFMKNYQEDNLLLRNKEKVIGTTEGGEKVCMELNQDHVNFYLMSSKQLQGANHFTASKQRYEQCKTALSKLEVCYVYLDLLDSKRVNEFKQLLDKSRAVVNLINVTNVFDYDANYAVRYSNTTYNTWKPTQKLLENLSILEGKDNNSIVLYSKMIGKAGLESGAENSVGNYKKCCKAYSKRINSEIFHDNIESKLSKPYATFYAPNVMLPDSNKQNDKFFKPGLLSREEHAVNETDKQELDKLLAETPRTNEATINKFLTESKKTVTNPSTEKRSNRRKMK